MRLVHLARPHGSVAIFSFAMSLVMLWLIAPRFAAAQQFRPAFVAQAPEVLPPPATTALPQEREVPEACKPVPEDPPLAALMVDVRPRDLEGNIVPLSSLPTDCATHLFSEPRAIMIDTACCPTNACDLLQLAAYCHNPLYFEERLLERYGKRTCCCQPLQSAACFYGNALCLPAKMWRNCPCSCVPAHPCD
jgi:hypothetical protein